MNKIFKIAIAILLSALTLFGAAACGKVEAPQAIKEFLCVEHKYGVGEVERWPTCLREGKVKHTCTECGNVKFEVLEKSNHTPYTVPAREATCAQSGYSEHTACAVCGQVIGKVERFEKLPCIDFSTYEYTGMGFYTCKICGDSSTEYTEAAISGKCSVWTESWYRVYLPTEESEAALRFYKPYNVQGENIGYYEQNGFTHDLIDVTLRFSMPGDKYVMGGGVDMTFGENGPDYIQFFLALGEYTGDAEGIDVISFTLTDDLWLDVTLTGGAKLVRLVGQTNENVAP